MSGVQRPGSATGAAQSTGAGTAAAAAAAAGATSRGATPSGGRLRSDFTRPPSAGPGRTPLRSGAKDALLQQAATGAPSTPNDAAYAHTNALYGLEDGAGLTANLRTRDYPQQQQAPMGDAASAAASAPLSAGAPQLARKLGAPYPSLQTHGDLWIAADQDEDREPVTLEVRAPSQASYSANDGALLSGNGAAAAAPPAPAAAAAPHQSAVLTLPAWLRTRPFSTCMHLAGGGAAELDAEAEGEPAPDLRSLPEAVREAALVDDLLFCFMGIPGRTIRPSLVDGQRFVNGPALAFSPAAALDERSAELVRKLLPLPEYAAVIERFSVTRDRWGPRFGGWLRRVGQRGGLQGMEGGVTGTAAV